jgi:Domain of unknown function (DUF222)/HNH endonuclease
LVVLQLAESAAVGLVAEAVSRGVVSESTAAGAAQWVARLAADEPVERLLPRACDAGVAGPLVLVDDVSSGGSAAVGDAVGDDAVDGAGAATDEANASAGDDDASDADSDDDTDGGGWVRRVPGLEPGQVSRIAKVATACTQRRNSVLADAVAANRVGVSAARTALVEVDKVMPILPAETRDTVFGYFLALPAGSGARAIRELTRRVIAVFADEESLADADDKLDNAESVNWTDLPNGMRRLVADLTEAHAAQLRHAIDALAAPSPGNTCCDDTFHRHTGGEKTGEADDRSPGKRHADALMLLALHGADLVDGDGSIPTSGQAKLVVTIDLEVLAGRLRGFGRTESGTALNAHLVRRLACDADVLPMVLGSKGEPLDVGREQRLVKDGMRAAVIERDRHCTYPGCGRPPSWCEAHHVIPWFLGGPTSLGNSALLCPRHHTIVHRDGYTATVTATGVTWDLTPG